MSLFVAVSRFYQQGTSQMSTSRVVITGLGVLAPNGHGPQAFERALREGRSGIRFRPELADLNFSCQVAGVPGAIDDLRDRYFDPVLQLGMDRYSVIGCIAGIDCWRDAGLEQHPEYPDWNTSIIFGSGIGGLHTVGRVLVPATDS